MDALDLQLQVERRLGITIPNESFQRFHTVADVIHEIARLLPRERESSAAVSIAFYELQSHLVTCTGRSTQDIGPDTRLESLFPPESKWRERRRIWADIQSKYTRVPSLGLRPGPRPLTDIVSVLLAVGLPIICGMGGAYFGIWIGILGFGTGLVAALLGRHLLLVPFETEFPASIVTVGDLAERCARVEFPTHGGSERQEHFERLLLEEVREILSDVTGVAAEEISPESSLVKDLGMG